MSVSDFFKSQKRLRPCHFGNDRVPLLELPWQQCTRKFAHLEAMERCSNTHRARVIAEIFVSNLINIRTLSTVFAWKCLAENNYEPVILVYCIRDEIPELKYLSCQLFLSFCGLSYTYCRSLYLRFSLTSILSKDLYLFTYFQPQKYCQW